MVFRPLIPRAAARETGVTVSWATNGRPHYQCCINLSRAVLDQLGATKPPRGGEPARVAVEQCVETNRVRIRVVGRGEGWALCWKQTSPGRHCAVIRMPLPDIHGEKRDAQACAYRFHAEPDRAVLEIDMPAWAQPPSVRRQQMEQAA